MPIYPYDLVQLAERERARVALTAAQEDNLARLKSLCDEIVDIACELPGADVEDRLALAADLRRKAVQVDDVAEALAGINDELEEWKS